MGLSARGLHSKPQSQGWRPVRPWENTLLRRIPDAVTRGGVLEDSNFAWEIGAMLGRYAWQGAPGCARGDLATPP